MTKVGNHRAPSRWRLLLFCLLVAGLPNPATAAPQQTQWRISHIDIRGTERTHDEIVRRELLFTVGDTVDAELIEETERNLRRLLFLGEVRLRLEPDAPDTTIAAHAIIQVQERYARALSPLLDGERDELSYGLVALDYNFLGRGQITQVTLFHDAITGDEIRGEYREPRLGGSRRALHLEANYAGDEGRGGSLTLSQPFYALDAAWAYGLSVGHETDRVRLYGAGDLVARYDDEWSGGSLWLIRSMDHGEWKLRPGARLALSDRSFAADRPFTYRPDGRRRVLPSLSLTLWRPSYRRERFVRGLGQIEDLQMGSWLTAQAGWSTRALGSDRNYRVVALQLAPRGQPTDASFLFGVAAVSSRWRDGAPWHVITSVTGAGYLRLAGQHVLATRIALHALHRPEDRGSQLLLGLNTGLRGYTPRRFDGSRRVLASIEARPVFWRHPQTVVGGVLFADGGSAWTPGTSARRWVSAAGAGLRVGLPTVYDAPIMRVDIAHGFDAGSAWQLAVGLGQAF